MLQGFLTAFLLFILFLRHSFFSLSLIFFFFLIEMSVFYFPFFVTLKTKIKCYLLYSYIKCSDVAYEEVEDKF